MAHRLREAAKRAASPLYSPSNLGGLSSFKFGNGPPGG